MTSDFFGMDSLDRVWDYASRHKHVKESLNLIQKSLEDFNYDLSKFCIAFNGGKDCTVLLHLVYTVLVKHFGKSQKPKLKAFYVKAGDIFLELANFVDLSVSRYNLDLLPFEQSDYKKALSAFKSSSGQEVEAIFMGTRESDVTYTLLSVQKTDPGWPEFVRINPILAWSYHDVWAFLRDLQIPYCSLYDKGYTSLGSRSKTAVNPKLQVVTPDGEIIYLPAYSLLDPDSERSGRSN